MLTVFADLMVLKDASPVSPMPGRSDLGGLGERTTIGRQTARGAKDLLEQGHRVGVVAAVGDVGIDLWRNDQGADDPMRIEFVGEELRPVSIRAFHRVDDHRIGRNAACRRQQIVELGARAGENQHLARGRVVVGRVRDASRLPGGRLGLTHARRIAKADVISGIDQ